jgi:hypothetical protein
MPSRSLQKIALPVVWPGIQSEQNGNVRFLWRPVQRGLTKFFFFFEADV